MPLFDLYMVLMLRFRPVLIFPQEKCIPVSESLLTFKTRIKTCLFKQYYVAIISFLK